MSEKCWACGNLGHLRIEILTLDKKVCGLGKIKCSHCDSPDLSASFARGKVMCPAPDMEGLEDINMLDQDASYQSERHHD